MILKEQLGDPKENLSLTKKKELKKINITKCNENIISEQLPSIQPRSGIIQKIKKKGIKLLNKDKHYYQSNRELIKQKAKKKYKERMRNRVYRFNYLAKQREYNKRRKHKKCIKINKLLYPYNPFSNDEKVIIVYEL
tara:strand:+ start:393 stop:803 length:411 start_codon:yes stop_codon:yes gene_type:complete